MTRIQPMTRIRPMTRIQPMTRIPRTASAALSSRRCAGVPAARGPRRAGGGRREAPPREGCRAPSRAEPRCSDRRRSLAASEEGARRLQSLPARTVRPALTPHGARHGRSAPRAYRHCVSPLRIACPRQAIRSARACPWPRCRRELLWSAVGDVPVSAPGALCFTASLRRQCVRGSSRPASGRRRGSSGACGVPPPRGGAGCLSRERKRERDRRGGVRCPVRAARRRAVRRRIT